MKKTRTLYHLIVDKSGSMMDCLDNTINGFNEQVKRISKLDKEFPNDEISVGLTTFNDAVTIHYMGANPQAVQLLDNQSYRPNGTTALLDAIGMSVSLIETEINGVNKSIDSTMIVVVITDGYENASQLFNFEAIRNLISRLEETGKWTFAFVGSTLDAVETADKMAFKSRNSFSFNKENMVSEVWEKLSHSIESYCLKKQNNDLDNNLFNEIKKN